MLLPRPNLRSAILAGSISAVLRFGLSATTLRADSIVVGAGPGGSPQVTVDDFATRQVINSFSNNTNPADGVTVATGDGLIVVGEGPGSGPAGGVVNIYNASGTLLKTLQPFGSSFSGGVTVAVGDGELVVGAGAGGGSQVSVFSDTTFQQQSTFNPFASTGFAGGVNVAVGGGQLVVSEASGGSQVNLYNDATLPASGSIVPQKTLSPFGTTFTGGVTVAVGDGLLAAGQAGGGSQVDVFNAQTYSSQFTLNPYQSFAGGVSVAMGNGELVTGAGASGPSQIIFYNDATFNLQGSLPSPGTFPGGVTLAVIPASQTWTGAMGGDWNTAGNWSPTVVPNDPTANAIFDASSRTAVSLSANTELNSLTFTANAAINAYTITINPSVTLTISGTGIVNNSGVAQTLVTAVDNNGNAGTLTFANQATAGGATIVNQGGAGSSSNSGATIFNDFSTAGQAVITNEPGSNSPGGSTVFNGGSAGSATIDNVGGAGSGQSGGSTVFNVGSTGYVHPGTAGSATITAEGATNGSASSGGQIVFNGGTAEGAILIANGGAVASAPGGTITFNGGSSASNASIAVNGGNAANAGGGAIYFNADASGGAAVVSVAAGGVFDMSGLSVDGLSLGAISGAGTFYLGSHTLTVGSAGLGATVSGTIADGGLSGGSGGSLVVTGSSSLTLLGQNTYTGATDIENGAVLNANAAGALPAPMADGGSSSARAALIMDQSKNGSGFSTLNLGASQAVASVTGDFSSTINLNGNVLTVGNGGSGTTTFAGTIADGTGSAGSGGLTIDGAATLVLGGYNTYTGPTLVNGGTLQVGNALTAPPVSGVPPPRVGDGNLAGTNGVTVAGGATLATDLKDGSAFTANVVLSEGGVNSSTFNAIQSGTNTLAGVISGPGIFAQSGTGTTILTGANTYSGGTLVSAGVLQIGTETRAGSIAQTGGVYFFGSAALTLVNVAGGVFDRDIDNFSNGQATVNINSANTITLSGTIQNSSGSIALNKSGPGTALLTGDDTYSGPTTVSGGILEIDSGIHSNVTIDTASALRGNGTVNGNVTVLVGGTYQPMGAATVVTGNLALQGGANLSLRLGYPDNQGMSQQGIQDEELVGGNLQLAGTIVVTPQAGFGVGSYELFAVSGTVDTSRVLIKATPDYGTTLTIAPASGSGGGSVVTLVVTSNTLLPTLAWDGSTTTGGGGVQGGTGTWDKTTTNWTNGTSNSAVNSVWNGGTAVFTNTGGTVTLSGQIFVQGLTFASDGYTIAGASNQLVLNSVAPFITVSNSGQTATISTPFDTGANQTLFVNGPGTLVLIGVPNLGGRAGSLPYLEGPVSVITGTLQLGTAAAPYYSPGHGGVTLSDGATLTVTNVFSGILDQDVTAGLAQSGTLNVASGSTTTLSGALLDNSPGQLALTVSGPGTAILANPGNTYSGATTIAAGTLQVGTATARGSIGASSPVVFTGNGTLSLLNIPVGGVFANSISNVTNGAPTITVNTVENITLSGSISDDNGGAMTFQQEGPGATTLTGRSSYAGNTTIAAGTLQIGDGSTFGTAIAGSQVVVEPNGSLALDLAGSSTFANAVILNTSAILNSIQRGTSTLSGLISGGGSVNQKGAGTTILTAYEQYGGPTTVSAGVLQIGDGSTGNLLDTSGVTVSGSGTLAIDLRDYSIFTPTVALSTRTSTLAVIAPGLNTLSGVISGSGGFSQNGSGTTLLTAAEMYSGVTNVNAGLLIVTGSASLAAHTTVNVKGGAFEVDADLAGPNTVNVGAAGTLTGNGAITGNVTLTGNGIIDTQGEIDGSLKINGGNLSGNTNVVGPVTASGASTTVFTISGFLGIPNGLLTVTGGQLAGAGSLFGSLDYRSAASSVFGVAIYDFNVDATSPASGPTSVLMERAGATLTLTGASRYTGGTTVSAGTLQAGDGQPYTHGNSISTPGTYVSPLGAGPVTVSGTGTLAIDLPDQAVLNSAITLSTASATLEAIQAGTNMFTGNITGGGSFVQAGQGTSVLANGSGGYTGATNVLSGTLEVDTDLVRSTVHVGSNGTLSGNGGSFGNVTLTGNGVIDFTTGPLLSSVIAGALTVTGGRWAGVGSVGTVNSRSGVFTIDGALNTFSGVTVSGGTLSGGGTLNSSLLYESSTAASTFAGAIANSLDGPTGVTLAGAHPMLTLSGTNTYTGATTLLAGTLTVTGSLADTEVEVNRGATLAGTGTIGGDGLVTTGGTIAPSAGGVPGNFTVGGNLALRGGTLDYFLGGAGASAVGNNGLITVDGNATFSLTTNLNIAAGFGFGAGAYNLLNVSGTLPSVTPGMLSINSVPAGFTKSQFKVQTSASGHELQLVVTGGPTVQYWNPMAGASIQGGPGSWDNSSPSWSDSAGNHAAWAGSTAAGSTAVFSAGQGIVNVTDNVTVQALGFVPGAGGYTIQVNPGNTLSITGAGLTNNTTIEQDIVTSGSSSGNGELKFFNHATAGNGVSPVTIINNGGNGGLGVTLFSGSSSAGDANIVNESGGTYFTGTSDGGTAKLVNVASNSFLDISGLTNPGMQIASLDGVGAIYLGSKTLTVGGANLPFQFDGSIVDGGANGGAGGSLVKVGAANLRLTGANTYTGGTAVKSGTLSIGDGQSQASLQSSVTVSPGATLDLELANGENFANAIPNSGTITLSSPSSGPPVMNNFTVSGTISGPGNLVKIGANTVTLAQSNTYTGGTAINAGTLITGSISGTGAGPVVVNASGALGGSGKITGPVTLNQGGTIAPGADAIGAPGSTLHAASLLWNPGGTLVLQLGGQADDALALTGALTKGTTGAGAGAFTIDIEDPASISLGDFTLATFTKTNFSVADFTLELPGNYSGHLLETAKSLVLDVESGSGFQTATTFDATGDSSQLSTVPEPGSATLLAFAGASLLARRRRRMS